jgi:hypothetical protein
MKSAGIMALLAAPGENEYGWYVPASTILTGADKDAEKDAEPVDAAHAA